MTHLLFMEGGEFRQCSKTTSVPTGVEYWHALPGDFPETREHRDAWVWTPTRPADGVGLGVRKV